jgi:hypothetical protein
MVVVVSLKLDKNRLSYGGGNVCYNLCFKTFFSILNISTGRLKWNKASINVEFNYPSNGGSGLSKLDINSLIYGCGNVIFCVTTCVSKRLFPILNVSTWYFFCIKYWSTQNWIICRMVVVVLSKLDIISLIYGCGNVIFCVTQVSKRLFPILNVST